MKRLTVRVQGHRTAWAIIDQAILSGSNFAVSLFLARTVGPAGFGAFAIAFAVWLAALGLIRALLVQPYVIEAAPLGLDDWRRLTRDAGGAVVVVAACLRLGGGTWCAGPGSGRDRQDGGGRDGRRVASARDPGVGKAGNVRTV